VADDAIVDEIGLVSSTLKWSAKQDEFLKNVRALFQVAIQEKLVVFNKIEIPRKRSEVAIKNACILCIVPQRGTVAQIVAQQK
jgi:hypothetical protein